MKFIGLDLGTSFLKGAVLDLDEATISHITRTPFPGTLNGLPPRHVEVEPEAVVRATQTLLDQLIDVAPDAVGVMVTGQMDGVILTDSAGQPVTNIISWRDQRILDPVGNGERTFYDDLAERLAPDMIAAVGNGLRPSLPICTLDWWARNGQLPDGATPASVCDFVLSTLSGTPAVCEPTMAASFGLLDLKTKRWHQGIIQELGLQKLAWPRVVDLRTPSYTLTLRGRQLPCYAPVGDHQCALVGALLQPNDLSLNISTGSQVGVVTPTFLPGIYESRPFFDAYLQCVTRIPAGRALNALVGLLTELAQAEGYAVQDPWAIIAAAVEATPQTDMAVDVSVFASPVGKSGALTNLTEENLHIGHLFRAAFQSMARNYQVCAERLAPPQPWTQLVFSGGLAQRFAPLREEIAARFGLSYRVCATSEDTLLGLIALARVATGSAPNLAASVEQLAREVVAA